ncbi:hypothetical protein [Mongoliitalea lutea]|uniref:Uncharacterized protein n=1 Tax=Mongoliitalea lutea TaxID=849756 RepID=A0A8J3CWB8_9BACT|nr:hypothetical protein [Mongoliitalea lutea]GHB33189.1 hypothetical protein GCM10008106_12650 [Mongoliitalea lutea]
MMIQFSQFLEVFVKNLSRYLILLVMAACSSGNNQKTAVTIKLSPETIEVPTIDFASSNPGMIHLFDSDSGEHVMIYNHVIKKLQISSFPEGKLKLTIPLEFDNEKRSRRFTGGTLIGNDSIFVTFYPPALGMINFNGELLWEQTLPEGNYRVSHIGNGSMIPLFISHDRVHGAQPFLMDHHRMSTSDIQKQSLVYSASLTNDKATWHEVYYALDYWEQGKKLSYFSWAKRASTFLLTI